MRLITVNYLINERMGYFNTIFQQLANAKPENREKVKVNILSSVPEIPSLDMSILTDANVEVEFIYQAHLGRHYMGKVEKGIETAGKYVISFDEEVFINSHIWDYMIENCHLLDDDNNLILTPLLSTGIPTVDWFVDQFFNDEDKATLINEFKNTEFFDKEPNCPGSSTLNSQTINAEKWDTESFYSQAHLLPTHYKGTHPVRVSEKIQRMINSMILANSDRLLEKQDFSIRYVKNRPYFCNTVYMIRKDVYHKIVHDRSLFVDSFDEVPLNKYRDMHNLNFLFINNAFGVHSSYNWMGEHYKEISDDFFTKIANEINKS